MRYRSKSKISSLTAVRPTGGHTLHATKSGYCIEFQAKLVLHTLYDILVGFCESSYRTKASDSSYMKEAGESEDDISDSDVVTDKTEDTETDDADDVLASSVDSWRKITSSPRAFLFTGRVKLYMATVLRQKKSQLMFIHC